MENKNKDRAVYNNHSTILRNLLYNLFFFVSTYVRFVLGFPCESVCFSGLFIGMLVPAAAFDDTAALSIKAAEKRHALSYKKGGRQCRRYYQRHTFVLWYLAK
jgi:hypothetical protein